MNILYRVIITIGSLTPSIVVSADTPDTLHIAADAAAYRVFLDCIRAKTRIAQVQCETQYVTYMARFEDSHKRKVSK